MWVQKNKRLPVKIWATSVEESAQEQIDHLADLPFAVKHIALMPDCHSGYGMPIGGVLATKDVVVVNAVGVDIGCFTGDTKVALMSGVNETLKNLYEKGNDVWVYSLNSNLEIVPALATPLFTRKDAKLLEVIISGGFSIKCTPDHKFMLLNGTYKEAKDLKPKDSLMPLYRTYQSRDGYEYVYATGKKGEDTHKLVIEATQGKNDKKIVHHKNHLWFDNRPENLEYLSCNEHSKLHATISGVTKTENFKTKRLETLRKKGFYDKKYHEQKVKTACENIAKFNNSQEGKEYSKGVGKRNGHILSAYNLVANKISFTCECGRVILGKGGYAKHKKSCSNHKVLKINELNYVEDVYCLNVPEYHNFALEAGVFVHNCGIQAVKLGAIDLSTDKIIDILSEAKNEIPVGFNHHKEPQDFPEGLLLQKGKIWNQQKEACKYQLASLGGGNHFQEIQQDSEGCIWLMVHSGSRQLGKKIADHYDNVAKELNEKYYSSVPSNWDLAFIPLSDPAAKDYMEDMANAIHFAFFNRSIMLDKLCNIVARVCGLNTITPQWRIDTRHNYAVFENHFGQNLLIHRKGAIRVRENEFAVIPGSMGTASYVVKGKGNPESFMSASHGAGRRFSRTHANAVISPEQAKASMGNVIYMVEGNDRSEFPDAYKDIEEVMNNQQDLVDTIVKLKPIGVLKG